MRRESDFIDWDDHYRGGNTPWDTEGPCEELARVIAQERIAPCAAIDLGCGYGTHSLWLARRGFDVTGVDVSALAIARARRRAEAAGVPVRFVTADLLDPPDLGGPYGFFLDRCCYHYARLVDPDAYLRTVERLIGPGTIGLVLAGSANDRRRPTRICLSMGGKTVRVLTDTGPPAIREEDIRRELEPLFAILWIREFVFERGASGQGGWLGWSCLVRREGR